MDFETDKEKLAAAIQAKVAELKDIWLTDPGSPFDETQVKKAVAQFKLLIPKYLDRGLSLDLAMTCAALAATAIVNHPRKMSETCEELGLSESQLSWTDQGFRIDTCNAMMCFLAFETGITREITEDDFLAIIDGKPLTYEEFPILALGYFREEIDRVIAQNAPLLN